MGITADGNSITVENCTITFNNAFDPTTGMATITITPAGGLGTLPGLLEGQPGLPPILQMGNVDTVTPGGSSSATLELLSPGGPGEPSYYQLNLGVPQGIAGEIGSFLLTAAEDVVGTVAGGFTFVWDTLTSAFNLQSLTFAPSYNASAINSTSGTAAGPRTLATVTVPAQAYSWIPHPSASCVVTGTANTQVNLYAFEGSTAGSQVGVAYGASGVANQSLTLAPGVPTGSPSSYGVIASGTTATIILAATQVGSTEDAWSTNASTTSFKVSAYPVGL